MLRSIREVATNIRRDKPGVVAYIEKSFKVTPSVAAEAYEDINGVIIESLVMPEEQLKSYLDKASSRGEIPKPLAVRRCFRSLSVKEFEVTEPLRRAEKRVFT